MVSTIAAAFYCRGAAPQRHTGTLPGSREYSEAQQPWLDSTFRRLRKLAGLEVCATVLVTAEVLAMPFYQAMRDATRSQLLRSICMRILCDEAAHLDFQALTLGLVRRPLRNKARAIRVLCHSMVFHCTALLLWQQHNTIFRAAGWNFRRFWNQARRGFARLQPRIWRNSVWPDAFSE
jgi:hypothetical protein